MDLPTNSCPDFCASYSLESGGYAYLASDIKPSAASVSVSYTDDNGQTQTIFLYATADTGHNTPVYYPLGSTTVVGFAENQSNCSPHCGCLQDVNVVEMPKLAIQVFRVGNVIRTYWNDGTFTTEQQFSASVPLPCGGYAFHASDFKDPAATVELKTCDDVVIGLIYPTAGLDHTAEVTDCDGAVIGFAANWSYTAPVVNNANSCGACNV